MIQIDNLKYSYGPKLVIDNITTTLSEGHIYGLLGENGVGKTTLLTLLAGLKKPQSGSIKTGEFIPYSRKPAFLETQYYLPDEVSPVSDRADHWGRSTGEFWPTFSYDRFLEVMGILEVDPTQKMLTMSAGQLKKVYISFALSTGAKYIFMDEPTNGLDIPSKAQFRSALMKYTSEDSIVVISTHQVRDLEAIIDPIIIMDRQDILVNSTLEEISSALYFDYGTTLHPESLYTEQLPGGFIQVYPNATGQESKVNIEALFNAVHKNKELIKGLLKK